MSSPEDPHPVAATPEPPVVARMVIELRSDGTTTIARGAIEDTVRGETVAVEAKVGSPLELPGALAKMLLSTPALAGEALRAALPSPAELRAEARARIGRLGARLRRRLSGRG
ncbi:MAG: hypothetical protein R3B09_24870 [Nannocystaceae bacterium]